MSDEQQESEIYEKPAESRGGSRPGAGRKASSAQANLAKSMFDYFERTLMDNAGAQWEATKNERKGITDALTQVICEFDFKEINNPYAALSLAAITYAMGGKDRLNFDKIGSGTKNIIARIKDARAEKHDDDKTATI